MINFRNKKYLKDQLFW